MFLGSKRLGRFRRESAHFKATRREMSLVFLGRLLLLLLSSLLFPTIHPFRLLLLTRLILRRLLLYFHSSRPIILIQRWRVLELRPTSH